VRVPDAVAAAKLWLVSAGAADLPYLSEGLYALVTVESDAVESVTADESWRLYVNPVWAEAAGVDELAREIAHQLWHLLLDHAGRARAVGVDRTTAQAWRTASDLGVADALTGEGVVPHRLREQVRTLRAARPDLAVDRATEEYWEQTRILDVAPLDAGEGERPARGGSEGADGEAEETGDEGSASDGLPRPWELPPEASGGVEPAQGDDVRRAVALAYRAAVAERPGHTPGLLDRWAEALAEPRIPWDHLLAQATRRGVGWTSGRTHTTYARPNRRAAATPGILLPGWRRQNPTVAAVIDTSGSVDERLLGLALGEVEGALVALGVGSSDLTVLTCDAAVHTVARLRRASDAALIGGGGTDLRVALAALETLRPRPTLAVVFTDGFTPWPDAPPPGCAVVVALLLRPEQEAPPVPGWATAIECREEG
jgi:predicted metal-dependent peptidase